MALVEGEGSPKHSLDSTDHVEAPRSKRFRVEELPLNASQKAVVDGLVHTIKKKGIYDQIRHQIFKEFRDSVSLELLLWTSASVR